MRSVAVLLLAFALGADVRGEDFEKLARGPLSNAVAESGTWSAEKGHAEIHAEHARGGTQSLRLLGGEKRRVEWTLREVVGERYELSFWAEMEGVVFQRFVIHSVSERHIKATAIGDKPSLLLKHIKAVTYHNLEIVKLDSGLTATVVFDV